MNDANIDRQMPQGEEVFLDHAGYFAADLEQAGDQMARLGFQVSGVNVQYNADAAEALTPSGTSNRLVKLRRGFLEILAATSETPLAEQLQRGLARYAGLHVVALTSPDMAAHRDRLIGDGFAMQPFVNLRRKISAEDGERTMAYTILRTEPDVMAEGRVQMLTTHTPALFWTPGVTEHENRADALTDLLICVDDRSEAAARFGRFAGRIPEYGADIGIVALDRGRILFAHELEIEAFLDRFAPPDTPYIAGQGVRSADIEMTGQVLHDAKLRPIYSDADLICLDPRDGLGAYLLFHSASISHPWMELARQAARS